MKIIQSFWAGKNGNILKTEDRWSRPHFMWLSWILSVNQLIKFYDEVELYTDKIGYEILIEKLHLPYTKVHIVFDELEKYPSEYWALAKIKAYSLQTDPFIHVDGDVFIWDVFDSELHSSPLIAQNFEITTNYYHHIWDIIFPKLKYVPDYLINYNLNDYTERNFACNMGVFGGNDMTFIHKYTKEVFDFLDNNIDINLNIDLDFNVFFEQVLLGQMIIDEKKIIKYVLKEKIEDFNYKNLGNFEEVPNRKYLHLLGDYKKDFNTCKMLETYVIYHYPEFFNYLLKLFPEEYRKISDIEHFNYKLNSEICSNFIQEVKRNDKCLLEHSQILARDLLSIESYGKYNSFITDNLDIELYKNRYCYNGQDNIRLDNICSTHTNVEVDEIDQIILEIISPRIKYSLLMKQIIDLVDSDATDQIKEITNLINKKLLYFLKHKILMIVN